MTCTARIRPFRPGDDTELVCELDVDAHEVDAGDDIDPPGGPIHTGTIGASRVDWHENDRRTFHDEWPGDCTGYDLNHRPLVPCPLPTGHRGGHA
jgi:hypothetical protein